MKLTVFTLLNLENGLLQLGEKELPISTSLKINRIIDELSISLHSIRETAQPILKKEKIIQERELNQLYNEEMEIHLVKIDISDLGNINISPNILKQIDPILVKKVEENNEN